MPNNQVMKNRCVCNQAKILSPTPVYFQCDCHHNVKSSGQHCAQGSIFSTVVGGVLSKGMV
ncbi:hypothetical protein O23A_p2445 [Aeromonas salmonicida]|nr:hypothetical protein O23A_p2445 [Aeromonas salmonicida]